MNEFETTALLFTIGIGAIVRWITGFGFSMVFVPITVLFMPATDAITLTICYELAAGIYMFIRLKAFLVLLESLFAKIAAIVGVYCAFLLSKLIGMESLFLISLAVSAALTFLLAIKLPTMIPSPKRLIPASIFSGLLGFSTGMAGPPIILYYYSCNITLLEVRRYLTGYFLILYMSSFLGIAYEHSSIIYERIVIILGGATLLISVMALTQYLPTISNKEVITRYALLSMGVFLTLSLLANILQ